MIINNTDSLLGVYYATYLNVDVVKKKIFLGGGGGGGAKYFIVQHLCCTMTYDPKNKNKNHFKKIHHIHIYLQSH